MCTNLLLWVWSQHLTVFKAECRTLSPCQFIIPPSLNSSFSCITSAHNIKRVWQCYNLCFYLSTSWLAGIAVHTVCCGTCVEAQGLLSRAGSCPHLAFEAGFLFLLPLPSTLSIRLAGLQVSEQFSCLLSHYRSAEITEACHYHDIRTFM